MSKIKELLQKHLNATFVPPRNIIERPLQDHVLNRANKFKKHNPKIPIEIAVKIGADLLSAQLDGNKLKKF